jgi:hypothetical protein
MSGVTARAARSRETVSRDAVGWWGAAIFAAAAGASVLALYLVHPIVTGYRFPIGPDGPVYTWLARAVESTGLPDGPGAGPGVPGLTVVLGSALGAEPLTVVTLLGPVLAAACGLAAAGLVEAALGPALDRAVLAVVLTGAFTAYLAGGWLANVAMVAAYLGALAALAVAGRSWRAVGLAAGLLVAAGLAHRLFLIVGVVILVPTVLARVPEALAARRRGLPWRDTDAVRLAVGVGVGASLAGAGLAWLAVEPRIPGDTSQDGFFRRLGLRRLLVDRYRERLWGDITRAAVPVAVGVGLGLVGITHRPAGIEPTGRRFLRSLWLSWAAVTVVGIAVLAVTAWGPPNRMLQFAFFVPIGAAAGAAVLARRGGWPAALVVLAVPSLVAFSMAGWIRQSPAFTADDLAAAGRAGAVVAALPPGLPVVVVVDTDQPAAAYHLTLAGNVLRMAAPADRIGDVRLAVGRPRDVLAGRPTRTGDPEHDRIAGVYLRESSAFLDESAILVVRRFNRLGYEEALGLGREVTDGVAVLRGPSPSPPSTPPSVPGGLGPAFLAGGAAAILLLLGALGAGWARWGLIGSGRRAGAAVAPSAGIGVAVVASFLADRIGLGPSGPPAVAAALALGGAGYVLAWRHRGPRSRSTVAVRDRHLLDQQGR